MKLFTEIGGAALARPATKPHALLPSVLALILGSMLTACTRTEYVHVGPNRAAALNLEAPDDTIRVEARGPRSAEMSDTLIYTVTSNRDGRLWILEIDSDDKTSLLSRRVTDAGEELWYFDVSAKERFELPMLEAAEPVGKSLVLFIVTDDETRLESVLASTTSSSERPSAVPRALHMLEERSPVWGVAKMIVEGGMPESCGSA